MSHEKRVGPPVAEALQRQATSECEGPWRFTMRRDGHKVAIGVLFSHTQVVLHWLGEHASTVVHGSMASVRAVHGHDGTVFEWQDPEPTEAFQRGHADAYQDSCENCPFTSVGGLDARASPLVPEYISDDDAPEWLRGYLRAACTMYGDDWRTCSFGWQPALIIGGDDDAEVT